MMQCSTFL